MFQRGARRWGVREGVSVHMQDLTQYLVCIHLLTVHASYIHANPHVGDSEGPISDFDRPNPSAGQASTKPTLSITYTHSSNSNLEKAFSHVPRFT